MDHRPGTTHAAARHRAAVVGALLASGLALAACTDPAPEVPPTTPPPTAAEPTPSATPDDGPSATPEPEPAETDAPPAEDDAPFPADREPDVEETAGEVFLSSVDLRFGTHDGYDRVVLELTGEGAPGWHASYVEEPADQASGDVVDVDGEAYLVLLVRGLAYPTEEGAVEYDGPQRLTPDDGGVIRDVVFGGLFEGQQEIFLGLASEQPFRVFRLEDPTRVVVDVQHP